MLFIDEEHVLLMKQKRKNIVIVSVANNLRFLVGQ
jgi:hypothetical protein